MLEKRRVLWYNRVYASKAASMNKNAVLSLWCALDGRAEWTAIRRENVWKSGIYTTQVEA